jgi:hypothetical protein
MQKVKVYWHMCAEVDGDWERSGLATGSGRAPGYEAERSCFSHGKTGG